MSYIWLPLNIHTNFQWNFLLQLQQVGLQLQIQHMATYVGVESCLDSGFRHLEREREIALRPFSQPGL